jgi:hypothetical protein
MPRQKPNRDEVKRVLEALTPDEQRQIRKENPFRIQRDAIIRKLCDQGVKYVVVAEISGLSDDAVGDIDGQQRKYESRQLRTQNSSRRASKAVGNSPR